MNIDSIKFGDTPFRFIELNANDHTSFLNRYSDVVFFQPSRFDYVLIERHALFAPLHTIVPITFAAWLFISIIFYMVLNLQSKNELIREKTERSITDNLTGVFNWDYIDLILMKDASLDQGGIVLYLDGNNVKMINDNYGHDYGDLAIKMICDVIKSCVRREDSVIRMGGDEFVVVLKHCDEEGAVKIYEKIADALVLQSSSKLPFIDEGVSVAPGYCLFTNRKDFEHAIINADLKMLESKQESKLGRA